MNNRSLLSIAIAGVCIVGIGVAALFDFPSLGLRNDRTFALAPFSLGNPAAAATLRTYRAVPPSDGGRFSPSAIEVPETYTRTVAVKSGETLSQILVRAGLGTAESHQAIAALHGVYDPRDLKAGQQLDLTFRPTLDEKAGDRFLGLILEPDYEHVVSLTRDGDSFSVEKSPKALTTRLARADGTIETSLYVAGVDAGLPVPVLIELIRIYSWDVDFQRDIRKGDQFTVMYQRIEDETGKLVRHGDILLARMTLSGESRPLYRFTTNDGFVDYFDDKGQSAKKALMRTPIDGARLSSGFGMRKHPVLGYSKMHQGVDFAAPTGTPIYAAGDGVVDKAGRNGGYGNYVRVRHNGEYATAYAHMSRIAKGVTRGARVRQGQVIGYVGTTGRSTGPHLHYEILKQGAQVNPLKVKMPSGRKLEGNELAQFQDAVQEIDNQYANLERATRVAEAGR